MHTAHRSGLVHRDLKPANILLSGTPDLPVEKCVPKIADFGLVKRLDGGTTVGAVLGTPSYMAPEQAAGSKEVGPAADVYALGAILYECLTGRPPFKGASVLETLQLVRGAEPVPPRRLRSGVPTDLENVCLKCLHKEANRRYADAAQLADELGRWRRHEPLRCTRAVGRLERLLLWRRRNPTLAAAVAVAVLLLAGVLAASSALALVKTADAAAQDAANGTLRDANRRLEKANGDKDAALRAKAAALDDVNRFTGMSARLAFERGQRLCEQGRVDEGMLLLVRALQIDPTDREGLHDVIRRSLTACGRQFAPLQAVLDGSYYDIYQPNGGRPRVVADLCPFALSADGRRHAVIAADGRVQVWETETDRLVREATPAGPVAGLALRPDGGQLLAAVGTTVSVWRLRDGGAEAVLDCGGEVRGLRLIGDGRRVAVGRKDGVVQVWDLDMGRRVGASQPHNSEGFTDVLAFSPDGRRAISGPFAPPNMALRLWDVATGEFIGWPLPCRGFKGDSMLFTPDGRSAVEVAPGQTSLQVWDCVDGKPRGMLTHPAPVLDVLSPDGGKTVLTFTEAAVTLWDAATAKQLAAPISWQGGAAHKTLVRSDGRGKTLASGAGGNGCQWWDYPFPPGPDVKGRGLTEFGVEALAADGRFALGRRSGDHGEAVQLLLQPPCGGPWGLPLPHQSAVASMDFCTGGDLFFVSEQWRTKVWKPAPAPFDGPPLVVNPEPSSPYEDNAPHVLAFTADGKRLLTGCGRTVKVWDAADGRLLATLVGGGSSRLLEVRCVPDGKHAVGLLQAGPTQYADVWDLESGRSIGGHWSAGDPPVFSPDGKTFVGIRMGDVLRRYDAATGDPIDPPLNDGTPASLVRAAYSTDGRVIVVRDAGRRMHRFGASDGLPLGTSWAALGGMDERYVLGPDDRPFVLSAAGTGGVQLLDAADGQPVGPPLPGRPAPARFRRSGGGQLSRAGARERGREPPDGMGPEYHRPGADRRRRHSAAGRGRAA